jgi:glutamine synthetase
MPKPMPAAPGNGLHVNLSLTKNGFNIFKDAEQGHSSTVKSFIAGILEKVPEITLFLNPLCNSYERFGHFEAPKYVSWSHQNRSQLVRIPAAEGERMRMELRSPDPSLNPYLAFALILSAGLFGIRTSLALPDAVDADLYTADERIIKALDLLPSSLDEAITLSENSALVKEVVGEELAQKIIAIKKEELSDFSAAEDKAVFYHDRYFASI